MHAIANDMSLEGKITIVTGGGRGIGRAVALRFAKAGSDVVVASRKMSNLESGATEIESYGRHALAIQTDIAVKREVDNMVAKTLEQFGTIDILVNNEATSIMVPLMDLREDGWDKLMNVNLKGYYLCSQAAARVMMEKKSGNIINLVTPAGTKASPMIAAYGISKAGVKPLGQNLAVELAPYNIRVNNIAPGMVKTDFSKALWSNPELKKDVETRTPLKRLAEPEEIASVALFLASDASSYMTGDTVYVDGGISA